MASDLRPSDLGVRIRGGRAAGHPVLFLSGGRAEADDDCRVDVRDRRVPLCGAVSMACSALPARGAPGLGRCRPMTHDAGAIYECFEHVVAQHGERQAVAGTPDSLTYA